MFFNLILAQVCACPDAKEKPGVGWSYLLLATRPFPWNASSLIDLVVDIMIFIEQHDTSARGLQKNRRKNPR